MIHIIKRFYYVYYVYYLWASTLLLVASGDLVAQEVKASGSQNVVLKKIPFKVDQGVAVDEKYFYGISNTKIVKCDKITGKVIATWKADRKEKGYEHFKHMNSGTVVEGRLYVAHSRFNADPNDCTVEIWDVEKKKLEHKETIHMPRKHGSLTWIDRRSDGSWWMCYAVYGKGKNKNTKLVKYRYENKKFIELENWVFPKEVVTNWGSYSCSGGSWGPDGYLYTTGHGGAESYVLKIDKTNKLSYVRTEKDVGFSGQAIAWDRSSKKPILWGIVRGKHVSLTLIPEKRK